MRRTGIGRESCSGHRELIHLPGLLFLDHHDPAAYGSVGTVRRELELYNPELSRRFGIRNVPTLLFFKAGELKDHVVGLTSKADLISRLNALK